MEHAQGTVKHTNRAHFAAHGTKRVAGTQPMVNLLVTSGLALMLLISAQALYHFGLDYESPGGSFLAKVHPGSWIIFLALLVKVAGSANPIRILDHIFGRLPGTVMFFLAWLVLLAQAVLVQKLPFTPLIDTFLMPIVLVALLCNTTDTVKSRMAIMLHVLFAANALLAIYEYLTGFRLTPFIAGTYVVVNDWRSTALFGHPLVNALLSGCYIIALCARGGIDLNARMRPLMICLQLAAMVAFGGRTSIVLVLPFIAYGVALQVLRIWRGERIGLVTAAAMIALVPLVLAGLAGLLQAGFFDRFAARFVDDNGSAQARLILLHIFQSVPTISLLLGPDQGFVKGLQQLDGSQYGLESLWLAFFLSYGVIVSVIFFGGLFAFCADIIRFSSKSSTQVFGYFFLVATTSVSLSAKTDEFGLVAAIVLILLRPAHKASTTLL